jgi:hypothetical protein
LAAERAEKFVITATFTEDAATEFEEDKMSELARQIDLISGGMPHDDAADELAPFIVRGGESVLEVSAEATEDGPFGTEAAPVDGGVRPSADEGGLPLPILIGSIAGALALCGGAGVLIVRRRGSFESLSESRENDDNVELQEGITYTSNTAQGLPSSGRGRSVAVRSVVESGRI